eukprot:TRINITY_DN84893_c0_g1_i1.p1 TRINITY_DN84893_c0_g1~~TRINITY_DN84893_c0_g1_i1.p1  ORF type:complete len:404 (+),score=44.47 TRINITY_DN84893_c0_g1_i1:94-1305(+)
MSAAQRCAGEWLVNASIMQCEDAILGRVHFTETGEMVYHAAGGDLVGRGVGHWFWEGPVLGFQLDIFQYVSTATKHVHLEPHRFRGIATLPPEKGLWVGEWHYCAFQQPPRLVGRFHAQRRTNTVGPPQSRPKDLEDLPERAKKEVIAKLDKISELPPMASPRWIPHQISGKIQDIHYVRSFLEPAQVEEFEKTIDKQCQWEQMSTRDTQEFGSSSRCPCGRSLQRVALPQWQSTLIDALSNLGIFHPVLFPANSVRINSYQPGQGIHPHMDGPVYYPRAAIVSLGSQCIFDFYPRQSVDEDDENRGFSWDREKEVPSAPELPPGTKPALSILLEPGSLLVFSGDAFIHHRHGILQTEEDDIGPQVRNAKDIGLSVGDSLTRGRRTSLTIRHLLPRCSCNSLI